MTRLMNVVSALLLCGLSATAQTASVSPSQSFNASLGSLEKQVMTLADAMPADKYEFVPSSAIFVPSQKVNYTGVRSFSALLIHIAQTNYAMASRFGGIRPEVDMASLSSVKGKDSVIKALADSFAFVHKAIDGLTTENALQVLGGTNLRVTAVAANLAHTSDEYGQMVEYARMNGVVPPASQK